MDIKTILEARARAKFATDHGTKIHRQLARVKIDGNAVSGDAELVAKIVENPILSGLFDNYSRSEVPIAGNIDGKFASRRIDRLRILPPTDGKAVDSPQGGSSPPRGEIQFIDYKTDTDKSARRESYMRQMREYTALLRAAYPAHTVTGYILWLSDWELEEVK